MLNEIGSHPYGVLGLSNFERNLGLPRHRWFQFKEGFSAELVRLAVRDFGLKRRPSVIDPFAGCGTTIVEAGLLGVRATGIEVNPFLLFAAKAKTTRADRGRGAYLLAFENLLQRSQEDLPSHLEGLSTFTETHANEKWLFDLPVVRAFTGLRQTIRKSRIVPRPLELALFGALLDCCNAKRDGKCLRYHREWEKRRFTAEDLRTAFHRRGLAIVEDMEEAAIKSNSLTITLGDCRVVLPSLDPASFDLLITSPPYLNSFDYSDVYRPELFAGRFVSSNEELRRIRLQTVCSHVQVKRVYSEEIVSPMLVPVLDKICSERLWNRNIPAMIRSYFSDLAGVLEQCHRIINRCGRAWIVVGTSAYAGVEVPVDLILADIAVKRGWGLVGVFVLRQLRAAGQFWAHLDKGAKPPLRESLILLEK